MGAGVERLELHVERYQEARREERDQVLVDGRTRRCSVREAPKKPESPQVSIGGPGFSVVVNHLSHSLPSMAGALPSTSPLPYLGKAGKD